jgi:hypothetical protein
LIARPPIALEIFSKFRHAPKNDFANPPVTPHATFGGRRSVGAVLPSFLSQSHGEHGGVSEFQIFRSGSRNGFRCAMMPPHHIDSKFFQNSATPQKMILPSMILPTLL